MATQAKYQGWANYETWNVALWFGNDRGLYDAVREHPERFTAKGAKEFVKELLPDGTPDFKGKSRSYAKVDWKEIADDFNEMRGEEKVNERRSAGWYPRVHTTPTRSHEVHIGTVIPSTWHPSAGYPAATTVPVASEARWPQMRAPSSLDRDKIQRALALLHRLERSTLNPGGLSRAAASSEAIQQEGLNQAEADILLNSVHVKRSEIAEAPHHRAGRGTHETGNIFWRDIPPGSRVELKGHSYIVTMPDGRRASAYWMGNDAAVAQKALDGMVQRGQGREHPYPPARRPAPRRR